MHSTPHMWPGCPPSALIPALSTCGPDKVTVSQPVVCSAWSVWNTIPMDEPYKKPSGDKPPDIQARPGVVTGMP